MRLTVINLVAAKAAATPAKPYLLDGQPATAREVINQAEVFGYAGTDGLFLTSEAAKICRQHGWRVEENPEAKGQ